MKVGRALIALLLANHFPNVSSPDALGAQPPDWLGYLIERMRSGASNCEAFVQGNAEVRFVIFNFDSIIEDRLDKALRNLYRGAAEARLQTAVKAIQSQIIHVHGQLEPPPRSPLRLDEFGDSSEWIDWLLSALSEIRVVLDQIEHDTLLAAKRAVRRSEILCFLGFAYASENLTRLNLPNAIDRGTDGELVVRHLRHGIRLRQGEAAWVTARLTDRMDCSWSCQLRAASTFSATITSSGIMTNGTYQVHDKSKNRVPIPAPLNLRQRTITPCTFRRMVCAGKWRSHR